MHLLHTFSCAIVLNNLQLGRDMAEDMAKPAEEAKQTVKKWYPNLVKLLPITELVDRFDSLHLLSSNRKSKFDSVTSPEEKVKCFLDEILIPGLDIEYTGHFDEMIKMMKESSDASTKRLAEEITREVSIAPEKDTSFISNVSSNTDTGSEYNIMGL